MKYIIQVFQNEKEQVGTTEETVKLKKIGLILYHNG
jgi:hypothetical protein